MATKESLDFIEIVEGRYRKEWRIIGTPYTVDEIALIYLNDSPVNWIVENYAINTAQVHAALAYYYSHQDEIDRVIEADKHLMEEKVPHTLEALIEETKAQLPNR
jgi:uncharacterized protein (DUF433 family)